MSRIMAWKFSNDRLCRTCWFVSIVLLTMTLRHVSATGHENEKKILVLYSYDSGLPFYKSFSPSLESKLESELTTREGIFIEHMDLRRYQESEYHSLLLSLYRAKYDHHGFDLIIAVNPPAMNFLIDHGQTLFPDIPVIVSSVSEFRLARKSIPDHFTGILTGDDQLEGTIRGILHMHPGLEELTVILGSTPREQAVMPQIAQTLLRLAPRITPRYLTNLPYDDLVSKIETLPSETVCLYVSFFSDSRGVPHVPKEVLSTIASLSPVPVYGYEHVYIGNGILGGFIHDIESEIESIVEIGRRILWEGVRADMPFKKSRSTYQFDSRYFERWGIDERDLPADSRILYRTTSFWEENRMRVIWAAMIFAAEGLLILALLANLLRRKKAENDLKTAHDNLERTVQEQTAALRKTNRELRKEIRTRKQAEIELEEHLTTARESQKAALNLMEDLSIEVNQRKKAEKQLKKHSGGLERRVKQRTKALEKQTEKLKQSQMAMTYLLEDVTESRDELTRLNTRLEAANKELEAFSYSVSHDLRAPLRAIDGFSQALLEDFGESLDAEGKSYIGRVRNAAKRMAELIDDILILSRITRQTVKKQNVNLTDLAVEIKQGLLDSEAKRKRTVDFIIQDEMAIDADPALARQMLSNLLENAWKFTGQKRKARIEFGEEAVDGTKTFYVKDNGAGFDMRYAEKLFGPFQRLHAQSEFPGTGIGLATVQRIVNKHGGKVWAVGRRNRGATFYFSL